MNADQNVRMRSLPLRSASIGVHLRRNPNAPNPQPSDLRPSACICVPIPTPQTHSHPICVHRRASASHSQRPKPTAIRSASIGVHLRPILPPRNTAKAVLFMMQVICRGAQLEYNEAVVVAPPPRRSQHYGMGPEGPARQEGLPDDRTGAQIERTPPAAAAMVCALFLAASLNPAASVPAAGVRQPSGSRRSRPRVVGTRPARARRDR